MFLAGLVWTQPVKFKSRCNQVRQVALTHLCPIPSLRESLLTICDCTFALLVVIRGSVEVSFLKIIRHFAI